MAMTGFLSRVRLKTLNKLFLSKSYTLGYREAEDLDEN